MGSLAFLPDWICAGCRQMREASEKEQEALRQAMKDRMRHIRADAEALDSDGEDEPWARKPIADRLALLCSGLLLAILVDRGPPPERSPLTESAAFWGSTC